MGERWTEEEIRRLVALVRAGHKPDRIAEALGRSPSAVASRISRTNVKAIVVIPDVPSPVHVPARKCESAGGACGHSSLGIEVSGRARNAKNRPLTVMLRRLELYWFRNRCIAQAISMGSAVRHLSRCDC